MSSYLGAFPFPSQAPAILTHEALLKVVTILTERYGTVIKRRGRDVWLREIYRSMAVFDRGHTSEKGNATAEKPEASRAVAPSSNLGFAIDAPEDDDGLGSTDEDDELVLAALDEMDGLEVFKQGEQSNVHHSIIPTDNLLKLVQLLLLIAPIDPQESLSAFASQLTDGRIREIRQASATILASFGGVEETPGVTYRVFNTVIPNCLPFVFDGLHPLFEHFLFAKDFDLAKRKGESDPVTETQPVIPPPKAIANPEPILRTEGEILNSTILNQLSFFIKGTDLFRRLRPLYSGNTHGFSMGSFEKQAFNWRAPSILLVSGRLLPSSPSTARERTLSDMLPPKRLPNSISDEEASSATLTFGAYIPGQWKHTHKSCFGDTSTILFQLSPMHDVFKASNLNSDYVYFNKPPTHPSGVGLGSAVPHQTAASSTTHGYLPLGPVSLHLDDALEFGIFTHRSEGGGSFHPSRLPCRKGRDWQDRFEIESLEVWGCGGDV